MRRAVACTLATLALVPGAADARIPARQTFTRALHCGPAGAARVSGALRATVEPHLRLRWSGRRVRMARAVATLRGTSELGVTASAGSACGLDPVAVAAWNAPPIRFLAGGVPVVVVPRVTLYVSAEARAVAPMAARIHGSLSATAGLRYDGRVHRIGRLAQRLSADPSSTGARGSLGARITSSVELLLYGQAGPRFDFGTGLEFDSGPPRTLSAPIELSAGLTLPGLNVGPYTVLSRTIPLASRARAERARIEWDTRADIDLHVWDANGRHTWFRESGIPGLLLSRDDTDGFGPETVEGDGGNLTFGVCDFDDRGAGRTSVAFSGADGRASVVVAHEGDSAILAGGYRPPPGWCQPRHG